MCSDLRNNDFETAQTQLPQSGGEITIGSLLGGRYLIRRKLGEGGMGVVYFATDQQVRGENFAIKALKREFRQHPESLELMREEVRRTRALGHPNIVGMYSLNSDRGDAYVLMEYLEGKTLRSLIDDDFGRGMPLTRAWPLIQDICAALAHAHDHNVIHSDLKPSNVFVMNSGKAKLLDFGIARAARGRLRGVDASALGALTPAYASCEMLANLPPDPRDDIYSLACVIYEMLCAKHPFGGCDAIRARDQQLKPAPLAALSPSQNEALVRALAFERDQRTASVELLLAELAASARVLAPPALLASAGVAAAVLVGGALWWAWSHKPDRAATATAPAGSLAASQGVLADARALAEQARSVEVDEADASLQEGLRWLRVAEQRFAAADAAGGTDAASQAGSALRASLRSGGRKVRLGSEPEEVAMAQTLCDRCAPSDFADEAPRTLVLPAFALDVTAVTNRAFSEFVQATHAVTPAENGQTLYAVLGNHLTAQPNQTWKTLRDQMAGGDDGSDYPVRGIDFDTAKAYCVWRGARLPREEEWEFVARGPERRIFPLGNEVPGNLVAQRPLLPVGEQAATGRFAVRGLGGSLWEWQDSGSSSVRVLRGASWLDTNPMHQRLAFRAEEIPIRAHIDFGFRCARTTDVWPDQSTLMRSDPLHK
jgi:formylglycine-generating enzyme required for sulfatase activity